MTHYSNSLRTTLLNASRTGKATHAVAGLFGAAAVATIAVTGLGVASVLCLAAGVAVALAGVVSRIAARAGHTQLGPYTLDEKIGEGGMGVVYRAHHAFLKRPTAIKLLRPERVGARNLERFEREVQLTSMLSHPNTISVYDFGRTPEGSFYYAMEYLDGLDLQTLVDECGPQHPARVAHLLAQLCAALGEAHRGGLIHRDVKPANVVVCQRGGVPDVVKVLDFGLIKKLGANDDVADNELDTVVGTPLYLSPESVTSPAAMDGRSDLYGVGALGYFLLTGTPPFPGKSVVEVCSHHLHTAPMPPSQRLGRPIPRELERLILSCLAKDPRDRPSDAAALRAALLPLASAWTEADAATFWAERQAGAGTHCSSSDDASRSEYPVSELIVQAA